MAHQAGSIVFADVVQQKLSCHEHITCLLQSYFWAQVDVLGA
jgi:hypothetical protein